MIVGVPKRKSHRKKIFLRSLLVFIALSYFFILRPVIKIRADVKDLTTSAKQLKKTFSQNDIDLLNNELYVFSKKYDKFQKDARSVYYLAFIPYVSDFKNGVEAGNYLIKAAKDSVEAITPYADLIGFKKGQSSFIEKSADERLQTAILTLDKIVVRIDPISNNIEQAEQRIKKINPSRYPKKIFKTPLRERVTTLRDTMLGVSTLFVDAKPFLKRLPEILGKDERKIYLVLFQNDKERRATGGFLTSYAVFTVEKGHITKEASDDIYQLDNSIPQHPVAPREILSFHKGVNKFFLRDSNLSPDFVESMKLFNELYQDSPRKVKYDGVIAVDSKVLVDMLTIFGDTEAGGVVFSAEKDKRCNCPQVLYTLFDIVDRPVNYIKENRKGILGQLMEALLKKVLGFSPSRYWGPFMQNTFSNLEQKHILLYFTDKNIQSSIEKLNFAGRVKDFDGDYLHINNVNFAGAKSNLFVSEAVTSKTKTNSTGGIEREVKIAFRNPYPHSDCNLERGGLCLNATLRNWIRVYVPEGSKLVKFKGSETKVNTYKDLGKTVFEGFLRVNPLGKADVTVSYTLPPEISAGNYKLIVQKQPGADMQTLQVEVDNKTLFKGPLIKDVVF